MDRKLFDSDLADSDASNSIWPNRLQKIGSYKRGINEIPITLLIFGQFG